MLAFLREIGTVSPVLPCSDPVGGIFYTWIYSWFFFLLSRNGVDAVRGVELFAGGGGLLLGSALAGVQHVAAAEWNHWACETLRQNVAQDYPLVRDLHVIEGDVRDICWSDVTGGEHIDLLTAGPPCQPFSLGGRGHSDADKRDMFPATAAVIAQLQPKAFVIENVKGLTRPAFAPYFSYIKLRLQHPELIIRENETWPEHLDRLRREESSCGSDLQYRVHTEVVNAADYGVPQLRHRVFFVGFRQDIASQWRFPAATHCRGQLLAAKASGEYWSRHGIEPPSQDMSHCQQVLDLQGLKPWLTVRDALQDMPLPGLNGAPGWLDHTLRLGAKSYPGHTGSVLDQPAKALKAGVHGVPGGENMMRFSDGSVRYFSTREAARIQTFPDRYALHGAWGEAMRQLGNAVPVKLAQTVVSSVVEALTQSYTVMNASPLSAEPNVQELIA